MTRTQLLLEPWHHKFLRGLARKKGLSISALLRQWIEERASGTGQHQAEPLLGIIGLVEDQAADVSENVDSYLYGKPRGCS